MRIVCRKEEYNIACPGVPSIELLQADKILLQKMLAKDIPVREAIMSVLNGKKRGRKKAIALVQRKYEYAQSCTRRVYEQSPRPGRPPTFSIGYFLAQVRTCGGAH